MYEDERERRRMCGRLFGWLKFRIAKQGIPTYVKRHDRVQRHNFCSY